MDELGIQIYEVQAKVKLAGSSVPRDNKMIEIWKFRKP